MEINFNKPYVYCKNDMVYGINNEFTKLTGYLGEEFIMRSFKELCKLLKIDDKFSFEGSGNIYSGYIFTKDNMPKYIQIICEDGMKEKEKLYSIIERPNQFLKGILATCIDNDESDKESVAIYSYPDFKHLKTNKNYANNFNSLIAETSELAGTVFMYSKYILNNIKGKNFSYKNEAKLIDMNGDFTYWDISGILIYEEGEPKYLRCVFNDQTEKVKTREALEKQKQEMEVILENIPDIVVKINQRGEYTYSNKPDNGKIFPFNSKNKILKNKEVFEFFKYNDINGNKLSFYDIPDSRALRGEKIKKYILIGKSELSTIYYECNGTPIYDEKGNIEGAVLIYKDIEDSFKLEEFKALEENIRDLEVKYTALSCMDFKIKYINDNGFKAIQNKNPNINSKIQLIGRNYFDFYIKDVNEKNEIIDNIKTCIEKKCTSYIYKHKDVEEGKLKYIKTIFQPIFDEYGQAKKINVIGMDITDEEIVNQNMHKSLKVQEEVFVNTSHELKTPINLIFSASQLLNMHFKNENIENRRYQIKNSNQIITQNCYRIIKIINNILDISKIEEGFYELELENKNIVNVIDDIVESVADYIKDKDLKIVFDPEIEEKIIALDLYKFERIMLNLISNAIKFSKDKGLILVSLTDKNDFIEISVKDEGIGIDEENIESIFHKFKQESNSLNHRAEGTGIGLSLVKSIVELHGGSIDVESTLNIGSKFTVTLPHKIVASKKCSQEKYYDDRVERIRFELSDIYS